MLKCVNSANNIPIDLEFGLFDSRNDEHKGVDSVEIPNIFAIWDGFFNGRAPVDVLVLVKNR